MDGMAGREGLAAAAGATRPADTGCAAGIGVSGVQLALFPGFVSRSRNRSVNATGSVGKTGRMPGAGDDSAGAGTGVVLKGGTGCDPATGGRGCR